MENYLIYNEELHRFVDENKLSHFDIDIKKIDDKFSAFDSKSNFFIENKKKLISSKTQFFLTINKNIKDFKMENLTINIDNKNLKKFLLIKGEEGSLIKLRFL